MLNIPDTVKALFKADGVRKNFRVHFPNGELSDLTNANVVEESVRFTESLCSQDVLKFGLTEASVLEFETVGVANMYGMTIECGIEIDLSSLSAADLATIAAGSWDGTYVAAGDSDLGFAFFRVPYGVFRVESCPRDHQAMTHRKVTGYGLTKELGVSKFEEFKLQVGSIQTAAQFTPTAQNLFYSLLNDEALMLANGFTKAQFNPSFVNYSDLYSPYRSLAVPVTEDQPYKTTVLSDQGSYYGIQARLYCVTRNFVPGNNSITWRYGVPKNALFSIDIGGLRNWAEDIATYLDSSLLIDYDKLAELGYSTLVDFITERAPKICPFISLAPSYRVFQNTNYPLNDNTFYLKEDIGIFYPYLNNTQIMSVSLPNTVTIVEKGSGDATVGQTTIDYTDLYGSELKVYEYDLAADYQISFESTGERIYSLNGVKYTIKTFIDCYDQTSFVNGFLEMNAKFGRFDRAGNFEMLQLDNSSATAVQPGESSGVWWDEYDVLPIGAVKYSFTDSGNNENVIFYQFGADGSLYDMTDNELVRALSNVSETAVNEMLDDLFIPYLDPITFTPIDLSMKGLPYIEAGDYLAVAAEDGTTAYSFNMRQELNGIQVLTATVESTSGDILEADL